MAAVLTLFGGGFVRACSTTTAVTSTNDVMKVASSCTTLVNKERAARGIKAVAIDGRAQTASQKHSTYQASKRTMTHRGATTATYDGGARLKVEKYPWTTWGENVAAGQTTCAQVMSAWMGSAGHKANILNPKFVHIGVSAAKGSNGVVYWTMDLAKG